jgi:hypothetical protein
VNDDGMRAGRWVMAGAGIGRGVSTVGDARVRNRGRPYQTIVAAVPTKDDSGIVLWRVCTSSWLELRGACASNLSTTAEIVLPLAVPTGCSTSTQGCGAVTGNMCSAPSCGSGTLLCCITQFCCLTLWSFEVHYS